LCGNQADRLVNLAHGRTGANELATRLWIGGGLRRQGWLAQSPDDLQRLPDHSPQVTRVGRLEEAVVGALLHRLDGRLCLSASGDEDDGQLPVEAADLLVHSQAALVGQLQVQ
jgi:hypothetical protein